MTLPYDAVLLIAFGGPTSPAEIRPFLARVLRGISIPQERVDEVAHHYEAVGGKSPLTEITLRQAQALQRALHEEGLPLPVYVGMRHSDPFIRETLERMAAAGVRRALCVILSSHQTEASWDRYKKNVAQAQQELAGRAPAVDFCSGWHNHPLFIQTWIEQIQLKLQAIPVERRHSAPLVFTAHSVPIDMAKRSPYVEQLQESAHRVAAQLGQRSWSIAFQSRSGRPTDPWLEPDILSTIRHLAARGCPEVIIAPIGFVCDHVELLYDLDIEAAKSAAAHGIKMVRVPCPNDHPTFIRMIAAVIKDCL